MSVDRPVILTPQGKEELEQELATLRTVKLPSVTSRIQELTLDGDVSDNGEYEDTKEELIIIEARMREIEHLLRHAQIVVKSANSDTVQIGSTVTLVDDSGEREIWTLVSPGEANTLHGKISTKSPVGAALLGKHIGDTVMVQAPGGETAFTLEKVE